MAATYAAQIAREWRWAEIREAMDNIIAIVREWYAEDNGLAVPTAGWDVQHKGITVNASYDEEEDAVVASLYMGSVMNLVPSGSFYAPWSAVPERVRDKDARWWAALETVASLHGLHAHNGEGDPTDVFLTMYADIKP